MVLPEDLELTVCWIFHRDGSCPVAEHLKGLKEHDYDFFAASLQTLLKLKTGKYNRKPLIRKLEGKQAKGLWEARIMGGKNRQFARYPFFYSKKREVVLLYGFTKKSGKTPMSFISRAGLFKELVEKGELSYEEIRTDIF